MSIKPSSRSEPSGRARVCVQLERHTQAYRDYLLDRGNAAGYVRSCEAAVVHLSMWMKQANKRLADVDEGLVTEFFEHLPGCRCATSARHPTTVRAALGHLLIVLRAVGAIAPQPWTSPRWAKNWAATTSTWIRCEGMPRRPARARCF